MEFPKVYDVVGYVVDGSIYCPDCAEGKGNPIFRSDEFDHPPVCEGCGAGIDATLTTQGKREIAKWFEEFEGSLEEFKQEMHNRFGEAGEHWVEDAVAAGFIKKEEEVEEATVLVKMRQLHEILRKLIKWEVNTSGVKRG